MIGTMRLVYVILICVFVGCQKSPLVEDDGGRNAQEEPKDSASVTPNFEAEDWEGTIDVNFGF
jgi:hypothetical protein